MSKILIEPMSDFNDCETCGGGAEYGGRVTIDGKVVFEYLPYASCYDNLYLTEEHLLVKALEALGHEVMIGVEID